MNTDRPAHRLLTTILLGIVVACAEPGPETPRLVILVATCSVNAAYLSPYNDEVSSTPNLAKFADESIVFNRHFTEAGQSGIAFASTVPYDSRAPSGARRSASR